MDKAVKIILSSVLLIVGTVGSYYGSQILKQETFKVLNELEVLK